MAFSGQPSFYRSDPRPACKKCGYSGHLTYECRNFVQLDPEKQVLLDVSSTSSESDDYSTPLTELRSAELRAKLTKKRKEEKSKRKKSKKKRKHSSSESEEEEDSSPSPDAKRRRRSKSKKEKKASKSKKSSKKSKKSKKPKKSEKARSRRKSDSSS